MEKLLLTYIGMDDWSRPVYKDPDGRLLKDTNCDSGDLALCTSTGNSFDGEPDMPIEHLKKYQNREITIIGRENEPTKDEKFQYMMLSRLKQDCEYYLGNGGRAVKYLWAGSEKDQIAEMKKRHNAFADDKKPEWLTWDEILAYETLMCL